ncbi:MAG: serine hydrolase domain-containing protein [Ktedonobacterales bacterium]
MQAKIIDPDALDRYLQQRAQSDAFSGVALITQGVAQRFAGAYGYASRSWKIPNTLATRFDTASVTKLFTAVATLQLIERGLLTFDTPVVEWLGLQGTAIAPTVTVSHLLTHTSGIADDADEESGEDYADLWKTRPNYAVNETADFLPQFAHKPPNFPPGQGCRYCNCGYVLLGLLIEKASGLSYRDYVRQQIFAPAGMLHSDFFRMDMVNDDVAEGCDPLRDEQGAIVAWKKNTYSYPPIGSPDGGAHVTTADLDRFLRQVKAGILLSAPFAQAFFTPQVLHHVGDEWRQMYGYGLEFAVDETGNVLFAEKEGINAGVSAVIRHYPEHDINVVLLANTQLGVWEPRREIHRLLQAADRSNA